MNIMNLSTNGLSARFFAVLTIASLLLTAFPVAFFVANAAPVNVFGPAAATVSTSTPYVSGSIDATGYTDLAFSFEYDIFALDDGDSFTYDVTVGGVSQGSGTIVGVDADTSVMTPVSVDLTAFPDATGVQLDITVSANTPSDVLEVQNIVLSGEPVIVTPTTVNITNLAELQSAIENQAPGQTWTIQGGDYGLDQSSNVLASGQTGWYFPIVEDDITINGVDNPVIYGDSYSANGAFPTQNLISVFGDNVTITGLTLMPKVQPNKTIEVLGEDFTLEDVVFKPNTKVDPALYDNITSVSDREFSREWGGSLYFSNEGAHVIKDVTIHNGGVSFSNGGVGAGTTIEFDNVQIVKETNNDFNNSYRYSSGFANSANSTIGLPQVTYRINQTLDNAVSVFANAKDGDTVEFDSDITTTQELAVITAVTINGNDFTISPDFTKDNTPGNNSALQVNVDSVTINNLNIDGSDGINLHGINTYKIVDLELNDVSLVNSDYSGLVVNGSEVKVSNITTAGNGWHGINVDQGSGVTQPGVLTISNTSVHSENSATPPSAHVDGVNVPHIFVDDVNAVVTITDTDTQYDQAEIDWRGGRAIVYTLKSDPIVVVEEVSAPVQSTRTSRSTQSTIEPTSAPTPQVLGVATSAINPCTLLTKPMSLGGDNDTFEVMKLQAFLNSFKDVYGGTAKPATGVFGSITDANVKAFQAHFRAEILDPWTEAGSTEVLQPTGYVYRTTMWKINSMLCGEAIPMPELQ